MLILVGLAALQVATSAPQSVVVMPGPTGPRISGRPSGSPAANEIVRSGNLTISNGHLLTFGRDFPARGMFLIANAGDAPDRLLGATSPSASRIVFMRLEQTGEIEVETVEIAPHSNYSLENLEVDFNRGRIQMRLEGLRLPANPSDGVPITFEFERAGPVTVRAFATVPNR